MLVRKHRRRLWLPALASVVVLAAAGCGSSSSSSAGGGAGSSATSGSGSSAPSGSTLTIADVAPFTGPDAALGPTYLVSCDAATSAINNAGGVLGHKLTCKSVDTRGDPADAVPAVRQMYASSSPALIIGCRPPVIWLRLANAPMRALDAGARIAPITNEVATTTGSDANRSSPDEGRGTPLGKQSQRPHEANQRHHRHPPPIVPDQLVRRHVRATFTASARCSPAGRRHRVIPDLCFPANAIDPENDRADALVR